MSNYVTLIGAEDVRRAASQMQQAAEQMAQAANQISYALEAHQRFLEQWLQDYKDAKQ